MANNVPQPLFAPASQHLSGGVLTEDFDLNEIFAEYFINEFDDPLNAYTGGMVTASGDGAGQSLRLPTGGIRTAFHNRTAPVAGVDGVLPPAKKAKQDAVAAAVAAMAAAAAAASSPAADGTGGMGVAAVNQLDAGMLLLQQQQQVVNFLHQQHEALNNAAARVTLPVGVGIRVGGIGGVAPAITQAAAIQSQLAMWGGQETTVVSAHAVAERRQRNREHAKRSRVRKKFMLESLQEEVRGLQKENQNLRLLIQEHIPENAMNIIAECSSKNSVFYDDYSDTQDSDEQGTELERSDYTLMKSLMAGQKCFVLSDPKLPDNPIVFASPGFYKLTGYSSKEVLGRNCRFLQGPGTNSRAVDVIRKAVQTGSDCTVCILNYKADGTPFWNQFFLAALRDADDHIVNYVGVQCEVEPEVGANTLEEKVNAVLPLDKKDEDDDDDRQDRPDESHST